MHTYPHDERPTFVRRRALQALALIAAASTLAACGGKSSPPSLTSSRPLAATVTPTVTPTMENPIPTTVADWQPVSSTLGRTGTLVGDRTAYRIALPRKDLTVTTQAVTVKPGFALGGYAAFARYRDGTMLMGDLVVTETELPKVTDALQAAGLEQTAIHKHLLEQSPPIWWTHIHGFGDPVKLAQGVKEALAQTSIPPASRSSSPPALDLDTAGIDAALGRHGTNDGGIYKFSIGRAEKVTQQQHVLPSGLGITTAINFQPLGGNRAAINGDFVMRANEVNKVIQALRKGGIYPVELHNHVLDENPRLFYLHFWATRDGVTLAKALRPALDATNLQPSP